MTYRFAAGKNIEFIWNSDFTCPELKCLFSRYVAFAGTDYELRGMACVLPVVDLTARTLPTSNLWQGMIWQKSKLRSVRKTKPKSKRSRKTGSIWPTFGRTYVTPYVSTPNQIRTLSKLNIFMCMSYWTTYFFYSSVVQKNLVFVVGLSPRLSDAEVLRKHEYFGKFGKIHKVVINTSTAYAGNQNQVPGLKVFSLIQRIVSSFNIDPS